MTLNQILGLYPEQNEVEIVFSDGERLCGTAYVISWMLKDGYLKSYVTDIAAIGDTLKIWIEP